MFQETVRDRIGSLRGHGTDDVLAALGLERRRTPIDIMVPAAGVFFAGVVFGAGIALLMAPKPGRETRRQLRDKASDLGHRLAKPGQLAHDARERLFGAAESRADKPHNGGSEQRGEPQQRSQAPHAPGSHFGQQK